MTWPEHVAVLIPTVACRQAHLTATVAALRTQGADPLVHLQDPAWPLGHASNLAHYRQAIPWALAQRPGATHLLLWEDDVTPAPELATELSRLTGRLTADRVHTLWSPGLAQHGDETRDLIRSGRILPGRYEESAATPRHWHGSLAILAPRHVFDAIEAWPQDTRPGWDIRLREWLWSAGERLWIVVPNLAEHRGWLSTVAPSGSSGRARSASFGLPVRDDTAPATAGRMSVRSADGRIPASASDVVVGIDHEEADWRCRRPAEKGEPDS